MLATGDDHPEPDEAVKHPGGLHRFVYDAREIFTGIAEQGIVTAGKRAGALGARSQVLVELVPFCRRLCAVIFVLNDCIGNRLMPAR